MLLQAVPRLDQGDLVLVLGLVNVLIRHTKVRTRAVAVKSINQHVGCNTTLVKTYKHINMLWLTRTVSTMYGYLQNLRIQ